MPQKMNPTIKATSLTMKDRIDLRINDLEKRFLNSNEGNIISKKEFKEFMKDVHVIITAVAAELSGEERR